VNPEFVQGCFARCFQQQLDVAPVTLDGVTRKPSFFFEVIEISIHQRLKVAGLVLVTRNCGVFAHAR
jgi:hypothetical protein